MERENVVKSVSRALDIIDLIALRKGGMGVTEIAKHIEINKSSVYRILTTLVQYGYIEQDKSTSYYKLGYKFLEVSSKLLGSLDLRTEASPFLEDLAQVTNEVIHLVVYDQGEVVYIEKLEGTETLRMHSKVGRRAPVHCTSVGKAILAFQPEKLVNEILEQKGMPAHTENTITSREQLLHELELVKSKGYALDLEENENGITCIAAPIFDHYGHPIAAISVSGPTTRMDEDSVKNLEDQIIETARKISERLGFNRETISL